MFKRSVYETKTADALLLKSHRQHGCGCELRVPKLLDWFTKATSFINESHLIYRQALRDLSTETACFRI